MISNILPRAACCAALAVGWLALPWSTPLILSVASTAVLFMVALAERVGANK